MTGWEEIPDDYPGQEITREMLEMERTLSGLRKNLESIQERVEVMLHSLASVPAEWCGLRMNEAAGIVSDARRLVHEAFKECVVGMVEKYPLPPHPNGHRAYLLQPKSRQRKSRRNQP